MKIAGIVGGTGWRSTEDIYRYLNTYVEKTLGGRNCANLILVNVSLQDILNEPIRKNKGMILAKAAEMAERGGADFICICSNGLHEFADLVQEHISIPLLHIADCVAAKLKKEGIKTVGLLGAQDTLEKSFYISHLEMQGIQVLIPDGEERKALDHIIFNELVRGKFEDASREYYNAVSASLIEKGAQGIIMGCTEIGELMDSSSFSVPFYDSALIFAEAIARKCIDA